MLCVKRSCEIKTKTQKNTKKKGQGCENKYSGLNNLIKSMRNTYISCNKKRSKFEFTSGCM